MDYTKVNTEELLKRIRFILYGLKFEWGNAAYRNIPPKAPYEGNALYVDERYIYSTKDIDISRINIPRSFISYFPSEKKLIKAIEYYKEHGSLDKPVIVDNFDRLTLTDNFTRLLVASVFDNTTVPVIEQQDYYRQTLLPYVKATFYKSGKEYIWRVPKNLKVNIGDRVLVETNRKNKKSVIVTVTDIFYSLGDDVAIHKNILKKLKR